MSDSSSAPRKSPGSGIVTSKGALKSAVAGRQYTQSRCHTAGFAKHDKCLVCVYNLVMQEMLAKDRRGTVMETRLPKAMRDEMMAIATDAPDSILQRCPLGNLHHRAWVCRHSNAQRGKGVSDHIVAAALVVKGNDPLGDRGLYPVQTVAVPPKPTRTRSSGCCDRPKAYPQGLSTPTALGLTAWSHCWL